MVIGKSVKLYEVVGDIFLDDLVIKIGVEGWIQQYQYLDQLAVGRDEATSCESAEG